MLAPLAVIINTEPLSRLSLSVTTILRQEIHWFSGGGEPMGSRGLLGERISPSSSSESEVQAMTIKHLFVSHSSFIIPSVH